MSSSKNKFIVFDVSFLGAAVPQEGLDEHSHTEMRDGGADQVLYLQRVPAGNHHKCRNIFGPLNSYTQKTPRSCPRVLPDHESLKNYRSHVRKRKGGPQGTLKRPGRYQDSVSCFSAESNAATIYQEMCTEGDGSTGENQIRMRRGYSEETVHTKRSNSEDIESSCTSSNHSHFRAVLG
eukprot:Nitzschia sp. Nitz4//scaffold83_size84149//76567//77241//NITZ4_005187-RA/size84149-processed-gene-0.43-mRNA-1//1//CDS//3329558986//5335//frame0